MDIGRQIQICGIANHCHLPNPHLLPPGSRWLGPSSRNLRMLRSLPRKPTITRPCNKHHPHNHTISLHNHSLLQYIFLLLLIFLIEAMVGILAYMYQEHVETELKMNLNTTMLTTYKMDDSKTAAIDFLQEKFSCCGAESFSDWKFSNWSLQNLTDGNKVPDSCCKTVTLHCGRRNHPSNINYAVNNKIISLVHNALFFLF